MKLIIAGCEYAGTTTLAHALNRWAEETLGAGFRLIHDHWKIPDTSGHALTDEVHFLTEQEMGQVLALSPKLKEMTQRHSLIYHTPCEPSDDNFLLVGYVYDDAVYAPLYFGYGGPAEPEYRTLYARHLEHRILKVAPEIVLAHVKASPTVITGRMRAQPHPHGVLQERDVEYALQRFEEEVRASLIPRRITLDTSAKTPEQTLAEFVDKVEPYLTQGDRLRMLARRN
jgi:hypothetical protein